MSGRFPKAGVAAFVAAVIFGALPFAVTASPNGSTVAIPQQPDVTEVCDSRDILLLIDQSMSLRTSDPLSERVAGAQALVSGLADAGTSAKLSIAGFGSTVTRVESFDLPTQEAQANATIAGFAEKTSDENTDYVLAMLAAVEHFNSSPFPADCRTLIWFTDGAHDIEDSSPEFVGSYTTLTSPDTIIAGFEGAVCGPLPADFTLARPLKEEIRDFEFVIKLIDLRGNPSGSQAAKRARTDQVLDRLLTNGVGDCGVNGQRIEVGEADEIVRVFFEEAQIQAGRTAVECSILQDGVPASVLESMSAFASPSTASIDLTIGEKVASKGRTVDYSPTAPDRARPVRVSVAAVGGDLVSCFAEVSAVIESVGEPHLYEGVESTPVYLAVGVPGVSVSPLAGVGPDSVVLRAMVDDTELPIIWDVDSTQWRVELPTPTGSESRLQVVGDFVGPLSGLGVVAPFSALIPVRDVPGVPQVRWSGNSVVEGTGLVNGVLEVEPSADTDGDVCFDFELPASLLSIENGVELGRFEAQAARTCHPAAEGFELPVTLAILQSTNATGGAAIGFSASYTPPGESAKSMGTGSVILPEFTLAKPVDSAVQFRLALVLAAASALLTYLLMLALTAAQAKLRPPSEMLAIRTVLMLDAETQRLVRADSSMPIPLTDFNQVIGTRTRYDLGEGIAVRRRLRANPFGRMSALVESSSFQVHAHPAIGAPTRRGRMVPVPLRFGTLVVVAASAPSPHAVALVPIGTTPTDASRLIEEGILKLDRQIRESTGASELTSTNEVGRTAAAETGRSGRVTTASLKRADEKSGDGVQHTWESPPPVASPSSNSVPSDRKPPPPPHRR